MNQAKHIIGRGVLVGIDQAKPGTDRTVISVHVARRCEFDAIELPLIDQGVPAPALLMKGTDHGAVAVRYLHRVAA